LLQQQGQQQRQHCLATESYAGAATTMVVAPQHKQRVQLHCSHPMTTPVSIIHARHEPQHTS
jgi:hypothetical protein